MRLKTLRQQRGWSLRTLGDIAGVHFVSLAKLEAGTLDPRLSTLRRLAKALEVTLSELVGDQPITKGGKSDGTDQTKRRVVRRVSRR